MSSAASSSQDAMQTQETANEKNYYEVLNVPFESSEEDIKKGFRKISLKIHPDKQSRQSKASLEQFYAVQTAWKCLSDPTKRLLYDLRNFGHSSIGNVDGEEQISPRARLREMQQEQALRDVENMQVIRDEVMERERKVKGLIVEKAIYGNLALKRELISSGLQRKCVKESDLEGPVCDVTVPLQCMVERHMVMIPGSVSSSKSDLKGFYNPSPLSDTENSVYVLYWFRNALHEVTAGDHETLSLPLRGHKVPADGPRGPFSGATIGMLTRMQAQAESQEDDEMQPKDADNACFREAVKEYQLASGKGHISILDAIGLSLVCVAILWQMRR